MSLSLLILGVLVTLAGVVMIAFGIPNNGFGIGNTLIMAGTTAFVGGLMLIALARALRQLHLIADGLMASPVPRLQPDDAYEPMPESAHPAPAAPRIPFPPKPAPRNRAPVPPLPSEPRLDTAPSIDTAAEHADRPSFFKRATEPRVIPERAAPEASLSPQDESRFAESRFAAPRPGSNDDLSEGLLATAFSRLDMQARPAAEPVKPAEPFESMWPLEARKSPETEPSPGVAERSSERPARDSGGPEESPEPHAVSILKSGVVDGMAYTLYSDGSIEAEMPQGTMRFASLSDLRTYLENSPS